MCNSLEHFLTIPGSFLSLISSEVKHFQRLMMSQGRWLGFHVSQSPIDSEDLSTSTIEEKVHIIYEITFLNYLWMCLHEAILIIARSLSFTISNILPFFPLQPFLSMWGFYHRHTPSSSLNGQNQQHASALRNCVLRLPPSLKQYMKKLIFS